MPIAIFPVRWYRFSLRNRCAIDSASSMIFYGMLDGVALGSLALVGVLLMPDSPELDTLERAVA